MSQTTRERVYLDHAATTPVHPEVMTAMLPYFGAIFGNPSSSHSFGRQAREAMDEARRQVAGFLEAAPDEVVFTSGGTEANNLALKGVAYAERRRGNHIVTTAIEHHSVLETCHFLARQGYQVTLVPVDGAGRVDPRDIEKAITPYTVLVSVMHANNEVGSVQPVEEIAEITRHYGVKLHIDAVQTTGFLDVTVGALGADLVSLSAHKIYGPKGVGALYVRRGTRLEPIMNGGKQDILRRAGTPDIPGIVGFARAVRLVAREKRHWRPAVSRLRDYLNRGVMEKVPGVWLNGHSMERLPGNLHLGFEGVDGAVLAQNLDLQGIAVSTGSACTAGRSRPSHVLTAMGLDPRRARSCIRFSLGWDNTMDELDWVLEVLAREVKRARRTAVSQGF